MKILIAHNAYQHRGGEDIAVEAEAALLRAQGNEVELYLRRNDELRQLAPVPTAAAAIWSRRTTHDIDRRCDAFRPDVIHVHNTLPLISPSLYWAAARRQLPVVQTLHNFRLLCPQAMLLRAGKACEDCIGKMPWRAVTRKCYRDSAAQSALLAGMLAVHRMLGTYDDKVTRYIVLNNFCREKFIQGGLPPARLRIKPLFVSAGRMPDWSARKGGLFVGRLSLEKGLDTLIAAMRMLPASAIRVVGSGPLDALVAQCFGPAALGAKTRGEVFELLHAAQYLVVPSSCYETFGLAALEAFACGTPVIASRHGGLAELIRDGVTGLLVNPGDARDLAEKIAWADAHPRQMLMMGQAARADYEENYTPEHNYRMLIDIYEEAISAVRGARRVA